MKTKNFVLAILIALLTSVLCANITVSAEEITEQSDSIIQDNTNIPSENPKQPPLDQEPTTPDIPTETPIITEEQIQQIVDKLQGVVTENTGITNEDISSISGKIYEWLDGKVSESIIVLVLLVLAIAVVITVTLVRAKMKNKSLQEQNATVSTQYNNLMEIMESFKGDKVAKTVVDSTQEYLGTVKLTEEKQLSDIVALLHTIHASQTAQTAAMKATWGNKVQGVNNILSEAPTQSAVNSMALYIKKLEDNIRTAHKQDADIIINEIKKESGV